MSLCPFYVKDARFGARLGNRVLEDGLVNDGLMEPGEEGVHMGMHAELCASTHGISREYVHSISLSAFSETAAKRILALEFFLCYKLASIFAFSIHSSLLTLPLFE